ncbi:Uncharacterized protein TCM_022380 [Theobroma cacao]|uniref:Uncharacterized protein n=1 Tax=Theobroma cacao TaxID=3641 RepID=A0A061ESN7_THECC|nr:Uncharacterized protein TCM_022380 [Theobroma cacao]
MAARALRRPASSLSKLVPTLGHFGFKGRSKIDSFSLMDAVGLEFSLHVDLFHSISAPTGGGIELLMAV